MVDSPKIIEVDVNDRRALEPLGTKTKWWVKGYTHLFKENYQSRREDCSEVIVARLCSLLGLPHASYQLGFVRIKIEDDTWDERNGVLSESFYQRGVERLIDGNQLLLRKDPDYPSEVRYKVSEYTIDAVSDVVKDLDLPPEEFCKNLPEKIQTATDVFVGYLLIDVLVANQDRHHENWGAIESGEQRMLTPTFDHGAALAPGETEVSMRNRLDTTDEGYTIEQFAHRARSPFWDKPGGRQRSLFDAWREFSKYAPDAAIIWQNRLRKLQLERIDQVLSELPKDRLSKTAKAFCLELIRVNRDRLLADTTL